MKLGLKKWKLAREVVTWTESSFCWALGRRLLFFAAACGMILVLDLAVSAHRYSTVLAKAAGDVEASVRRGVLQRATPCPFSQPPWLVSISNGLVCGPDSVPSFSKGGWDGKPLCSRKARGNYCAGRLGVDLKSCSFAWLSLADSPWPGYCVSETELVTDLRPDRAQHIQPGNDRLARCVLRVKNTIICE